MKPANQGRRGTYVGEPAYWVVVHASEAANNSNLEVRVPGDALEGADNLKGGLLQLTLVHDAGWYGLAPKRVSGTGWLAKSRCVDAALVLARCEEERAESLRGCPHL